MPLRHLRPLPSLEMGRGGGAETAIEFLAALKGFDGLLARMQMCLYVRLVTSSPSSPRVKERRQQATCSVTVTEDDCNCEVNGLCLSSSIHNVLHAIESYFY